MSSKSKKPNSIKNNWYALKLLWKIYPRVIFHIAFHTLIDYGEWLFYSAFFMRYVINALQEGRAFSTLMIFIGICIAVFASKTLYTDYLNGTVFPIANAEVNKKLYQILFKKSRNVELECFENAEFYDKYTLAMKNADTRLVQTVEKIFGVIFGAAASVCAFIFMFQVDKLSVAFILLPIIGNFWFRRLNSHIDYKRQKDMAVHNRRIDYINRVMYLKEYAKELRLTKVFRLLRHQYRDAITGVAVITTRLFITENRPLSCPTGILSP